MRYSELEHDWRTRLFGGGILLALLFLLFNMWKLQVGEYQVWQDKGMRHSVRVIRQPGLRGKIIDATGQALAENRPSHGIAIYMAELRQDKNRPRRIVDAVEEVVEEIAGKLDLEVTLRREDIKEHFINERFRPLLAWRNLEEETIARYAEQIGAMPGVDIYTEARRAYPLKDVASHIIGYVGRGNTRPDELEPGQERWLFADEMQGREGLERLLNETLRGEPQEEMLLVDVSGYRHDTIGTPESVNSGSDLVLTLNSVVQRRAEQILGEDVGAICVVSPQSGNVLALASNPRYDLSRARYTNYYSQLLRDRRKPLVNKAISEHFAPGSTFKPIVALAGLQSGRFNAGHTETCDKYFDFGNLTFKCTGRHGTIDMRTALETSCNIYFYKLAHEIGYTRIQAMGNEFGIGRKTGIANLPEASGLLPTRDAIKERHGYWAPGFAIQAGIGQGEVAATPLQMTMATAAIANGGLLYEPRLIDRIIPPGEPAQVMPKKLVRDLRLPGIDAIRQGMRSVVYGDRGTARRARVNGLVYAGKTGTAQFGREDMWRGWMVAFAPYRDPQVAITVLIQETPEGSKAAADKMKLLLESLQPWLTQERDP